MKEGGGISLWSVCFLSVTETGDCASPMKQPWPRRRSPFISTPNVTIMGLPKSGDETTASQQHGTFPSTHWAAVLFALKGTQPEPTRKIAVLMLSHCSCREAPPITPVTVIMKAGWSPAAVCRETAERRGRRGGYVPLASCELYRGAPLPPLPRRYTNAKN